MLSEIGISSGNQLKTIYGTDVGSIKSIKLKKQSPTIVKIQTLTIVTDEAETKLKLDDKDWIRELKVD